MIQFATDLPRCPACGLRDKHWDGCPQPASVISPPAFTRPIDVARYN